MRAFTKQRGIFAARIAALHFAISLLVAAVLALLLFGLWYPSPYRALMGSFKLFWLVVGVDVCCGPLLTFILSDPAKKRRERWLDYSLVVLIQIGAFAYGVHGVYVARPVVLAFETDRLRALAPLDIKRDELALAPPQYRQLPRRGVLEVATRRSRGGTDTVDAVTGALDGYDIGQRPSWWIPYGDGKAEMKKRAKPLTQLLARTTASERDALRQAAEKTGFSVADLFYLPLTSPRSTGWTAILNAAMEMVAAAPVDAFPAAPRKEKK